MNKTIWVGAIVESPKGIGTVKEIANGAATIQIHYDQMKYVFSLDEIWRI